MASTFETFDIKDVTKDLDSANEHFIQVYPGESTKRQPVHTVYGGANLFKSETALKIGSLANKSLLEYAPNFVALAHALEFEGHESLPTLQIDIDKLVAHVHENGVDHSSKAVWLAHTVYEKVKEKVEREPLEDFRIDFEDGFGNRGDKEEDETAIFAAKQVALGMKNNTLSPFIGIRIKPFNREASTRGIRTLDLFITTLANESGGKLPDNFVVTLPKVEIPEQVTTLVKLFKILEEKTELAPNSLKMEIMIETTQAVIDVNGNATIRSLINAAEGRCTGAHFGTYDYTASTDVIAKYQLMDNPVCDFARHIMKVSLMGTGVFISDGATNVMPVGPHRATADTPLTSIQIKENIEVVHKAWKLDFDHIRHSLYHAFYQGWDLHPAQFPIRYAANYSFFLESYVESAHRLKNFVEKAAQATLSGDVFDDAATGQGLLNYFLRALNSGALNENDIKLTGLSLDEIKTRSFLKILEMRSKLD